MPSQAQLLLLAESVLKELPEGWRVKRSRRRWAHAFGGTGICYSTSQRIEVPWPPTHVETVAVIAHEVAHALLHGDENRGHVMEYEAEMWSFRWLRSRGVRVPRFYQNAARRNVKSAIKGDIKAGVKIRPSIRRWAYRKQGDHL